MATIPYEMEVEAHFLAKENGIVAGIELADLVFHEVDPSLKVLRYFYVDCLCRLHLSGIDALANFLL